MAHHPVVVPAGLTLGRFVDEVVHVGRYTTPVTENGSVVGLLPFRRVAEVPRAEWEHRTARDTMIPLADVPTVGENDDLMEAAGELSESDVNRALVLDGERLVGLLSVTDVARALEVRRQRGS